MKPQLQLLLILALAPAARAASPFPPDSCRTNPGAVSGWLRDWRESRRLHYASIVSKDMNLLLGRPGVAHAIPAGARCIKAPDASSVAKAKDGDYYVVSCIMQTKNTVSHVLRLDLGAGYGSCIDDKAIADMLASKECQNYPNWPARWFAERVNVPGCVDSFYHFPPPGSPVSFFQNRPPQVTVINLELFNQLLNERPGLRDIVDETTRKLKRGGENPLGGNPLGPEPPGVDSSSRDAK